MQSRSLKHRSRKFQEAWYDYCITNRLIAYGEVPPLSEEEIEERCKKQLEEDVKRIKEEYKTCQDD